MHKHHHIIHIEKYFYVEVSSSIKNLLLLIPCIIIFSRSSSCKKCNDVASRVIGEREKISKECRSIRRGIHIKYVVFGWSGRILRDRCWLKVYLSLCIHVCSRRRPTYVDRILLSIFFMKRQRVSERKKSMYCLLVFFYIFFYLFTFMYIEKWQWDPPLSLRQHIIHFRFHFFFLSSF